MSPLSTSDVATKIGVHKATLERWLANGTLEPPKALRIGKREFRHWTDDDIKRAQRLKGTLKTGPRAKKQK
jgi:DNA-binding transcriptional MerR regulator